MNDKQKIERLKQQGWQGMSTILDEHMPQDEGRGIVWWYWLAGAAAMLLAGFIPWVLLQHQDSSDILVQNSDRIITLQKEVPETHSNLEEQLEQNSDPSKTNVRGSSIISDEDQNIIKEVHKDVRILADPCDATGPKSIQGLNRTQSPILAKNNVVDNNHAQKVSGQKEIKFINTSGQADRNDHPLYAVENHLVNALKLPSFMIHYAVRDLPPFHITVPSETITSDHQKNVYGLVFSEVMGSFSDAFGFVNAGPGVQYQSRKWSLGVSGGISIPLPDQKAFGSSNLDFSNQYNFGAAADRKVESATPGLTNSSSYVYYERYGLKPGWMAGISAGYHLAGHWGMSADLARIGFRYDFIQRTEPNNQLAARTEAYNLRNNIWYGGLSVSYLMGKNWQLNGGVRMVNLLGAGDVGVLPALKVEYIFN